MSNISPEQHASLEERARRLQQNLWGNIIGSSDRDPTQSEEIWGDDKPAFVVEQDGVEAVFGQQDLRFNFGTPNGRHAGIYPIVDGANRATGEIGSVQLGITPEGAPKFKIYPAIGAVAVQNAA